MYKSIDFHGNVVTGTFTYKNYKEAVKGAARLAKIYGDYVGIEPDCHNRVGDYNNNVWFATVPYAKHRRRIVAIVTELGEHTWISM